MLKINLEAYNLIRQICYSEIKHTLCSIWKMHAPTYMFRTSDITYDLCFQKLYDHSTYPCISQCLWTLIPQVLSMQFSG